MVLMKSEAKTKYLSEVTGRFGSLYTHRARVNVVFGQNKRISTSVNN